MTVSDFTERELIARIQRRLPPPPAWLIVGIGDDGAVVEPERNRVEVFSTDTLVEGVHFESALGSGFVNGHRALAVNLSDLAAMGASPRLALLSLALPPRLGVWEFDHIIEGFTELAKAYRLHVVGGNLTRTPGPLTIDVTVVGTVKRRQALTRGGARPGDELYVSGVLGSAAVGLRILKTIAAERRADPDAVKALGSLGDGDYIRRYLRPDPRVRLGVLLARNRAAAACIDLSDGLADGVHRIAEASGVGMTIDADALPIDPGVRRYFEAIGIDPVMEAMTAGDDYELLMAVRPRMRRRLDAIGRQSGVPLTRIGRCTADRSVTVAGAGREPQPVPPGYSHFR